MTTIVKTNLTEKELSLRFGVPAHTLQHWRRVGGGPQYLKIGRLVRYPIAEVERFERSALRSSTSDLGGGTHHAGVSND